ncbi:hypothetical protein LB543_24225 [Mesorhizobium sp. ESP7-2]|uniref:hypothetical protein n=1 Tax=Mesorhizobium sp. ESP7-2 TaxID=2876622 RepID=UPI001CC9A3AB|nr:hypothetical protein [Mesorhizobium sp. ESP7-2]MBZ9709821.1 hypothetical protein [Mesorhizobium sp. ESP7-2]
MITDPIALGEVQHEWSSVVTLANWSRSYATLGGFINETPPEGYYNLPLIVAFCALDDFLLQCVEESIFNMPSGVKKRFQLGDRMDASRSKLVWQDFDTVDAGRKARNDLAHRAVVCSKEKCFEYINAIGKEFYHWGIIT